MSARTPADREAIDRPYGLEPVFEPGRGDVLSPTEFVAVDCPYCGESFETAVDVSAGPIRYIEDCQVCCEPIELTCEASDACTLLAVKPHRMD